MKLKAIIITVMWGFMWFLAGFGIWLGWDNYRNHHHIGSFAIEGSPIGQD